MPRRAFTLVEILIVVVILGILAAIVVPQYAHATEDAATVTAIHDLQKLRRAIEVYKAKNANGLPSVTAGKGTWGEIVSPNYLKRAPYNNWVGGANGSTIIIGNGPDAAYQKTHGWIYDDTTGEVWAGSFDAKDEPLPKP